MNNLYIDVGSTNIKWSVGSCKSKIIPFPKEFDLTLPYFEVPIAQIKKIILDIVNSVQCQNIFFSIQMHGYVLLGKKREELTEYISWRDRRAGLVEIPFRIDAENGVSIKPNLPRASVYAMKILNKNLYSEAYEFCTLGSYIVYILTGINKTHITDAAASGFYNVITGEGNSELILPSISQKVEIAGYYRDIAVYTPVGDQQAAVLGCNADESSYIMNLGTAGQLCCINNSFIAGDFESRPFFNGKTLCTVSCLMAGKEIKEYIGDWRQAFYEDYSSAVKRLPERNKIVVTGGVVHYYKNDLIKILKKIYLPFEINEGTDALDGLKRLSKEIFYAQKSRYDVV